MSKVHKLSHSGRGRMLIPKKTEILSRGCDVQDIPKYTCLGTDPHG